MSRVERLVFRLPGGDWDALFERLRGFGYRAAVVGPHGSGKTTLLDDFDARLSKRGWRVHRLFTNREAGRALPSDWRQVLRSARLDDLLLVDGYECLSAAARWTVRRKSRAAGGLVVTSHGRTALPTLLHTATSVELLTELVDELLVDTPFRAPSRNQLSAVYNRYLGNLRLALRELYDRADEFALPRAAKPGNYVAPEERTSLPNVTIAPRRADEQGAAQVHIAKSSILRAHERPSRTT